MLRLLAGAIASLLVAAPAQAVIFEIDITPGDGAITRDTRTALDWLDLDQTAGLSYDEILADAGGWISAGWRHATPSEVCLQMDSFGYAPDPCPGIAGPDPGGATLVHLGYLSTLTSIPIGIGSSGLYDDGNPGDPLVGLASIGYFLSASSLTVTDDIEPSTTMDPEIGHFLVRDMNIVPALPPWGVALLGALVLAAARRMVPATS